MLQLDISQIIIQIIAFLLMLWIMKKYGWQPLLDVLENRRKKIQEEFDSINAQKAQVKQLSAEYEEKLKEIGLEARKKIQEAVAEGQQISREIQEKAQAQAAEILQRAKSDMEGEVAKAKMQLKNDMINLIVNTTEKILQEKLDAASQKKLVANFIEEAQLK